jgi:hypothetical protein
MINGMSLSFFLINNIKEREQNLKLDIFETTEDRLRTEGEVRILKQLYEDFNLESVNKNDLEYHNDF